MTSAFTKFFSSVLLTFIAGNLNDFQFIYINYFNSIISLVLLGLSKPTLVLTKDNMPDNLMGFENLCSIYGQMFITSIGLLTTFLTIKNEPWNVEPKRKDAEYLVEGFTNTAIFLNINIFFVFSIGSYFISHPFKERIYNNYLLIGWLMIGLVYNCVLVFNKDVQMGAMGLYELEKEFKGILFIIIIGFSLAMLLYEETFVKRFVRKIEMKNEKEIKKRNSMIKVA